MNHEVGAGRMVAGKYRLVEKLGEGGMGAVWRADHVTLGSPVAVKLINQSQLDSEDGVARFLNEARAAALLRSPHVVQILDHGVDEGVPFMVMELLDGESLAGRLARVGTLPLPEAARLVTHVARAITKAHEAGIVHRDLKPDNIFLVRNDDEELAKVLDFGIAKMTHGLAASAEKLSTRTGALLGTPYYMSPEQVRGHAIDWRTDLWALAVITYECVVGAVPFNAETVGDLLLKVCSEPLPPPPPGLPASFDAWFRKAVARPREERFQSAREMAEALRALASDSSVLGETGRFSGGASSNAKANADTLVAPSSDAATPPDTAISSAPTLDVRVEAPKLETIAGTSIARQTAREPAPRRRALIMAVGLVAVAALGIWIGIPRRSPALPAPADTRAGASSASAPAPFASGSAAPSVEPAVTPAASAPPAPVADATAHPEPTTSARAPATATPSAPKPLRVAPPKATATAAPTPPPNPPPKPKSDPLAF